jgi:lipopolysaccharide export system permease protein
LSKFDRYVLSQLLVMFGFFSLILVAVFWINKAVSLFDRLIGDGQSAMVFLEFSTLGLPTLIATMLPLSSFAASVYITNRLNNESELIVMQATGSSPWRLARPFAAFGLVIFLMMSLLTHILVPASRHQLTLREAQITQNITAKLLTEGTFLHPSNGVTFYIGAIDADGGLRNVYLSDRRDPSQTITYTASRAFLVQNDSASNLIMVDGMAQHFTSASKKLSVTNFSDFSYDISALTQSRASRARNIREVTSVALIGSPEDIGTETNTERPKIIRELRSRTAAPLFCFVAAMIGFSTLLLGGYSRFGVWRQAGLALAILVSLEVMRTTLVAPAEDNEALWFLIYLPTFIGLLTSAAFLYKASKPNLFRFGVKRGSA